MLGATPLLPRSTCRLKTGCRWQVRRWRSHETPAIVIGVLLEGGCQPEVWTIGIAPITCQELGRKARGPHPLAGFQECAAGVMIAGRAVPIPRGPLLLREQCLIRTEAINYPSNSTFRPNPAG